MNDTNDKGFLAYTLFAIGGFLLGILVMFAAERALAPETVQSATESSEQATTTSELMEVSTELFNVDQQPAGHIVSTTDVRMPVDGWLVVHEVHDGHVGNALGAARRDEGTYDSVDIELLRATIPEREYMVILYKDNENKVFEIKTDLPVINTQGNPVMHSFTATVQ